MASAATYIASLRAIGISATDLDDAAVTALIGLALTRFNRYKPLVADRTFVAVDGQQVYTWTEMGDTAGVTVLLAAWTPYQTGDEWNLARTLATLGVPREAGYWHMPSQIILDQIKASAWAAAFEGAGYQNEPDGGSLYLTPTPEESGDDVYILYTKRYAAVADVPTDAEDLFSLLLEHLASRRMVNEMANKAAKSRVVTPEYQVEIDGQIRYWRDHAKEVWDQFVSACQAGHAAATRT
jgi:hypothetical protein